jgi:hypothetical protein
MKVKILKTIYKRYDQESWSLFIDDRFAEFTTWSDGRTWLNYYVHSYNDRDELLGYKIVEYCNAKVYLPLDEHNPARTIDKFYKLMMLQ